MYIHTHIYKFFFFFFFLSDHVSFIHFVHLTALYGCPMVALWLLYGPTAADNHWLCCFMFDITLPKSSQCSTLQKHIIYLHFFVRDVRFLYTVHGVSTRGPLLSSELQLEGEQHLLGAALCDADGQLSPITAQLYASASLWGNHNGPEEANGNEAGLPLAVANQERRVAESNSFGGKGFLDKRQKTNKNKNKHFQFSFSSIFSISKAWLCVCL